jgi:hypothetical protein
LKNFHCLSLVVMLKKSFSCLAKSHSHCTSGIGTSDG